MIKKILLLFLFCGLLFSQASLRDIQEMTNDQLNDIKSQLLNENENKDIQENYTPILNEVSIKSNLEVSDMQLFGYDYFKRDINFFDNAPTPSNYLLGPGDEVVLSMWGETNLQKIFTLNKEGLIYFEDIGFINLTNKNLKDAELLLIKELSKIYSTLSSDPKSSELMLELGKLKSINMYFTGHIEKPGINLIHPFSDIFSAIVQAGGIKNSGSLRNIQLIRDNVIIETIDFYSFFIGGTNNFSNIKLIDGDVIHIPVAENKVTISGEINSPGFYEILNEQSLESLINDAGGFTSVASSNIVVDTITPLINRKHNDNARSSINLDFMQDKLYKLYNGDVVNIQKIGKVSSKVEVFGRVKNPGEYSAKNMTLKMILDIAGGFDDPIYLKTIYTDEIVVLRKDEFQLYGKEIKTSYKDSHLLELKIDDKIFVYEDINYRNSITYNIEGEVNKPGTYPLKRGITVQDALDLAGGLTELATPSNIIINQSFTDVDEFGNETLSVQDVANIDSDFELGPNSTLKVLPYENVVSVQGNVYNPGLVAYSKGITMGRAITLAGGYKPYSMKKRVYVKRANGAIDKAKLFRGKAKILMPGDTVVIPVNPNPSDFDITNFIADISSTLANIAAILVIIDRN